MNILVWNECYVSGGADWSLIDLISEWPNKDDKFTVYINQTHEGLELVTEKLQGKAEVKTYRSWLEYGNNLDVSGKVNKIKRKLYLLFGLLNSYFSYRKMIKQPYDLLLVNNGGYPGGLSNFLIGIILRKKVPLRLMIVRNYPPCHYKKNLIMQFARYVTQKCFDKVITVSYSLQKDMLENTGISKNQLMTIHNGISMTNKVTGVLDIQLQVIPEGVLLVGIIGNTETRKGHAILFQAWTKIAKDFPSARLVIAASSKTGNKVELLKLADKLNLSSSLIWVEFSRNIGLIYQKLDIVVMPSLEYESFGRIAVEAMAFKKPIIASRVGGLPEIIQHNHNGLLFEKGNVDELYQGLKTLLIDRDLRMRLSQNGYVTYFENFTAEKMSKKYHQLISSLMLEPQ